MDSGFTCRQLAEKLYEKTAQFDKRFVKKEEWLNEIENITFLLVRVIDAKIANLTVEDARKTLHDTLYEEGCVNLGFKENEYFNMFNIDISCSYSDTRRGILEMLVLGVDHKFESEFVDDATTMLGRFISQHYRTFLEED